MNFPVFDLHCDTALALLGKDLKGGISLLKNEGQLDLERAKTLSGFAQCFACFTTPEFTRWYQVSPVVAFERELANLLYQLEKNEDIIGVCYTADDVQNNLDQGKMSAILTLEGSAGYGFDPALLEDLYKVGFRIASLGWNESNPLTGSHVTGEGLTDLGREFVKEANRVGLILDVSHISDQGFFDVMEVSEKPVIATHSNSRRIWKHSRNLTDDMFRAICQKGGVAGFNQYADFVGEHPNLDTACDHILHFLELDPEGRHIALGGDLDGCDTLVRGFEGVQSYPLLAQALLRRGVGEKIVHRIFWDNAMEVFKSCCT